MNLYFRLGKILFLYLFGINRRSKNPTEIFTLNFRAWPQDLDFNFHMNNGRYLTVMDLGRLDLMLRLGIAWKILRNLWMPIVGVAFIRFRRPLGALTTYRLQTRIAAWDDKWFYIEQTFMQNGEIAAVGYVKGLIRGRDGAISPATLLNIAGANGASPPVPEVFRKMHDTYEASRVALA